MIRHLNKSIYFQKYYNIVIFILINKLDFNDYDYWRSALEYILSVHYDFIQLIFF